MSPFRSAKKVRVLMLGWEYPPRLAGGLGKACQGLSTAMAKQGSQVFFVLPTFPERIVQDRLEVVGARECLIDAGWDPDFEAVLTSVGRAPGGAYSSETFSTETTSRTWTQSGINYIQSQAQLFPYGVAPDGPIPERIHQLLTQTVKLDILRKEWGAQGTPDVTVFKTRTLVKKAPPIPSEVNPPVPQKAPEIYGKNLWAEIEKYCFTVRHLADTHEVDVIHAHDWMTFPAAFEFQRATGAPVFLHVHATEYDRSGEGLNNDVFRIEREGFRRATHIFAVSRYTAGIIERLYGVNRKKISVIYNAPEHETQELLAPNEAPRQPHVVFLGRLTFQKGPDYFLRAAAMVAEADPTARFIICGTGDMMEKLKEMTKDLGIEDRVHFAGFVNPAGVDEILIRSKVLVMPSISEPFGLVALEAIRCGIPVILSKQSGVREVLHRALQVDFWDTEKLADQIIASLRLPDLTKQLVDEGLEQVQQLSWDKSAHKVIDVYRRYIGSTYAQALGGTHGH